MSISVQHNSNGSITVTCGNDMLTFFPNAGATAGAGGGGGGPVVIPVIDPDDDPLVGWPLPGALVARGPTRNPLAMEIVRVRVDRHTGELAWGERGKSMLRSYAAGLPGGGTVPLNISAAFGHRFDIGPVAVQLRQLQAELGHRVLPYLTPGDDEPVL
ncbi:hypothetical protein [Piscinibacter sp.]|uniref:hypothetical protein n=1 Tax=Piscinibacter sp. TaxID=1903157 RepID=UPI002CA1A956|nr:hypothetical protein [Albitalea sp.]HUG22227.1 hypothetical protein [Albitalea sp.]